MTFFLGERPQSLEAFRASFRQATEDVANQGGRLAYVAHPARGSEVPCGPGGKVGGDWRAPKAVLVDTRMCGSVRVVQQYLLLCAHMSNIMRR